MKKTFTILSAAALFSTALILGACGNDEDVKKQTDDQNAKIQALADSKLAGLQDQVNQECAATVDSLAQLTFQSTKEEHHGGGAHHAPKPAPKTVATTPTVVPIAPHDISHRGGTTLQNTSTINSRGGTTQQNNSTINNRGGAQSTPATTTPK